MVEPMLEILAAMFMSLAAFLVAAEVITRQAASRARTREERPHLGRAWWAQKEREAAERRRALAAGPPPPLRPRWRH
ncbi:MAG: hypothetical protein M9894_22205 [Planctomycetes bacterium]|nr:hypothetical protein [Planctomycetota bacterium]